ncbi:MAG: YVTN family beta-propeller protein [Rhodothermales bacterium]|jgi:YVTN family beta-propeller protein
MKAPLSTFVLAAAILSSGCAGAGQAATNAQASLTTDFIYVCNQGEATVSVIDARLNEIVETIDLKAMGYPANAKPHHVVVEPDGSFWYLSMIVANRVLKFNRDNEVVGSAEFAVPGMMALNHADDVLYVGRSMAAVNPPQSIGIIRRGDMTVDEVDVFFPRPHAIAVTLDGGYVLSASLAENRMVVLDQATGDGTFFDFGGPVNTLVQFAISPDGNTAIVGGEITNKLFFLDTSKLPAISVRSEIEVGSRPWHPIFAADGRHAYFGNKGVNTVTVVDTQAGRVVKTISGEGMAQPHGSAISADGRFVYISQQNTGMAGMAGMAGMDMPAGGAMNGHVVVIDTATNEIAKVIEVGVMPSGVGSRGISK